MPGRSGCGETNGRKPRAAASLSFVAEPASGVACSTRLAGACLVARDPSGHLNGSPFGKGNRFRAPF